VELRAPRARSLIRLLAVALALAGCGLAWAAPARAAGPPLHALRTLADHPAGYRLNGARVLRIASRSSKVRSERHHHRRFTPTVYTRGPGRWQVSWFDGSKEVAQVRVDDFSGAIVEQWTGYQVAWTMARGYAGAFGRTLNAPWVWIPLCLLFLAPFVDPRRPFRLLHLDLLMLLAFGVSHIFFNLGEITTSVPLAYPVLLYLLVRLLLAGFRPRRERPRGRLVPLVPVTWLVLGLVLLVGFRVALNVEDSNVIDVGYAGVIGADRIVDGKQLYGEGFNGQVQRGDTYGPVDYLTYVPFEQLFPWSGTWDDLPAAHGAALAFDLLTLGGLILLGMRLRAGPAGRELGVALGFAWAAYPYSLFTLESNSNDALVALFTVAAMLALTLEPARRNASVAARAAAVALGVAAKFIGGALAPLFAAGTGERRVRDLVGFALAFAVVLIAVFAPFVPDGGLSELYDRTVSYQVGRPSPFSIWGQHDWLDPVQAGVQIAAAALAILVFFLPRRRDLSQVAALGAAVLIAFQLGMTHWFYLYVAWFAPLALVALAASWATGPRDRPPPVDAEPTPARPPVAA
jgi:hypothetical protein